MSFALGSVVKTDLHLHSSYSADGWPTPEEVVRGALARGLDKIAITDHETIAGALAARQSYPDRVIVGEEVNCSCGTHLIGLFLTEHVPSGQSIEETAEQIRAQGGVVYGPHPFAYLTRAVARANRVAAVCDVLEVFNSRAFVPRWNRKAAALAEALQLPAAASSDAHFSRELGRGHTELPEFTTADEFRISLRDVRPRVMRSGSAWLHVASATVAMARRLTKRSRRLSAPTRQWRGLRQRT